MTASTETRNRNVDLGEISMEDFVGGLDMQLREKVLA